MRSPTANRTVATASAFVDTRIDIVGDAGGVLLPRPLERRRWHKLRGEGSLRSLSAAVQANSLLSDSRTE